VIRVAARPGRRRPAAAVLLALSCAAGAVQAQVPRPQAPGADRGPQERSPAEAVPSLRLTVAADTVLFPAGERLPLVVRPARPMALVATVFSLGQPGTVVWRSDTVPPGAEGVFGWNLRMASGAVLPSGRYVVEVTGRDSSGVAVRARRVLLVTQLAADTQPLPRPLGARELEPETVVVRQTAPWAIFIGTGAGLLPSLLGRRELNDGRRGDPKAWIVVGSVTVAGFVAFFVGQRPEFSPANAAHNAQLRREREADRATIVAANAQARVLAPYRIQDDGSEP
jgi:hypothetical protein